MSVPSTYPDLSKNLLSITAERVAEVTDVATSPAGVEVRRTSQAAPTWLFTLSYAGLRPSVAAPSPWDSYSEAGALLAFLDACKGRLLTFPFTHPLTGTVYTARFDDETLDFTRADGGRWWSVEVKIRTVL